MSALELNLKLIVAGVVFGLWPLVLNRTGVGGNTATAILTAIICLMALPFALRSGIPSQGVAWGLLIVCGLLWGFGTLLYNDVLVRAPKEVLGTSIILMLVMQAVAPVLYHVTVNAGVTLKQAIGIGAAFVAVVMLL